jgi:undecaprenyl-diphosphatase
MFFKVILMDTLQAIIISIVEGITEFLPISSTGHMIITQKLLGIESTEFVKAFTVNIQFGAILSVVVLYWRKFMPRRTIILEGEFRGNGIGGFIKAKMQEYNLGIKFYSKLFVAVLPASIGFVISDYVDSMLESVTVVAISLILGGIVLLFIDNMFGKAAVDQEVTYKKAFKIGFFQCIAMIPGVSRSAATIIGGMASKLTRQNAAEFSFFLAVPTMFGASAYKLLKNYQILFDGNNLYILIVGNVASFIVAMLSIKYLMKYLTNHGFRVFGWYRIIVGAVILTLVALGIDLQVM